MSANSGADAGARHLAEVTWTELRAAVAEMIQRLNLVSGSGPDFNLYAAVCREWKKARGQDPEDTTVIE